MRPSPGWAAAGYRVHPDGGLIPIRPTIPLYGLGPESGGDRSLGAWQARPDMRRDDPMNTIDYVELCHDFGEPLGVEILDAPAHISDQVFQGLAATFPKLDIGVLRVALSGHPIAAA